MDGVIPRQLALAVLVRALQDVILTPVQPTRGKLPTITKAIYDAKDFLFGEGRVRDLRTWCEVAEVNFDAFLKRAKDIYLNKIPVTEQPLRVVLELDGLEH